MVTAEVLPLIGVKPVIGRWFTPEEDRHGAPGTVIPSYSLWQGRFGGSTDVLGKKVILDDEPCTVIGVMPAGFAFPRREDRIWLPMRVFGMFGDGFEDRDRSNRFLVGVAKPRRGVSVAQANSEPAIAGVADGTTVSQGIEERERGRVRPA